MLVFSLCSGVLKGAGATAAAGHAAQGCNAEDHLPSALVQRSPAEKRVSGHETGSHLDTGKHMRNIYFLDCHVFFHFNSKERIKV